MEKYSLKFVNEGKPFCMPKWTTGKHKAALAMMIKECKGMSDEDRNEEFNFYVIYQTLHQVDNDIDIESVRELHPEDLIELFNAVYNAGKEGIFYVPQKGKQGSKKSTGKKN